MSGSNGTVLVVPTHVPLHQAQRHLTVVPDLATALPLTSRGSGLGPTKIPELATALSLKSYWPGARLCPDVAPQSPTMTRAEAKEEPKQNHTVTIDGRVSHIVQEQDSEQSTTIDAFTFCKRNTLDELETAVKNAILKGWQPFGSVFRDGDLFVMSMVGYARKSS